MNEHPIVTFSLFYFNKTPLVTLTVVLTLFIIIAAILLFIYIVYIRIKLTLLRKRKEKNFNFWSEKLFLYLDQQSLISGLDIKVAQRDIDMFIEFLFYYLNNIKGDDAEKVRSIFRDLNFVDREIDLLSNSSSYWKRALAAYRLGQMKAVEAKSELGQSLHDKNDLVVSAAAGALMKIGDKDSIGKVLVVLLNKENLSGELFAEILLGYGKGVAVEISESISIYNDLPKSRTKIIDFLSYYRRIEIVPFLMKLLETTTDEEEKIHVIKALGNITAIQAFPLLVRYLRSSNPTIKSQAAKSLGYFKEESAFDALSELLEDKDWWCRYHAAMAIFKTGESGREYLKSLLKKTDDPFAKDVIRQMVNVPQSCS
jgi:hypothetical protein